MVYSVYCLMYKTCASGLFLLIVCFVFLPQKLFNLLIAFRALVDEEALCVVCVLYAVCSN